VLEQPGFDFGRWNGGETRADGSIAMPYYDFSSQALELLRALPVVVFDWPAWKDTAEGRRLLADHEQVAQATPNQLARLSTTLRRADRFSEGTLAWAFETGLLTAIVRRAAAIHRSDSIEGERPLR